MATYEVSTPIGKRKFKRTGKRRPGWKPLGENFSGLAPYQAEALNRNKGKRFIAPEVVPVAVQKKAFKWWWVALAVGGSAILAWYAAY